MPPAFSEHADEHRGRRVDHCGLAEEIGRGVHDCVHADDLRDLVERAEFGVDRGEQVERRVPDVGLRSRGSIGIKKRQH